MFGRHDEERGAGQAGLRGLDTDDPGKFVLAQPAQVLV
jgi:hypothetical protein